MKLFKRIFSLFTGLFALVRGHKYIFVTMVFCFILLFVDDNNLIKFFGNQNRISALEEEIAEMRKDSVRLIRQQAQFGKDGNIEEIERMGREKGMHKDNEDVFIIEQ